MHSIPAPKAHVLAARFRILIDIGLVFNHLYRADIAVSRFRKAEELAQQMPDAGYESL